VDLVDDFTGMTPLMYLSAAGHLDGAELLLDKGADPNRSAANGGTPLYFAMKGGGVAGMELDGITSTLCMQLLVERGGEHES
jgi:ankyrin repeat protein